MPQPSVDESIEAAQPRVCLGAIAGAFGVQGEARIKPFTDAPGAVGDYGPLQTEDGARAFSLRVTRALKGGFVAARLSGVETREAAEALRGVRLYAPRSALPETADEDEFYHADLIGMRAVDLDGKDRGRVKAVLNHGAGDLLEVDAPETASPALLPFTKEVAPHVDLARGVITIDPPVGVFEADGSTELGDGNDRDAESDVDDGPAPASERT